MNLKRSLENLFKGSQAVLPMTRSKDDPSMAVPVTADDPLPVTVVGGGSADHLNPTPLWNTGYTPAQNGTLLIQNLCRDCYFEAYPDQPPMLADPPEGATPVISVAPESWARVPLQAGQTLSLVMHGYSAAPHFHEVRLVFLPGVTDLAAGPMPRHPVS